MLTHRNLLFMSQCNYANIDQPDERDARVLAAPVSHGAGLYALPFLLKGAHQIVLPHFEVAAILAILQRHPLVSMFAAPTMLTRLVLRRRSLPRICKTGLDRLEGSGVGSS